MPTAMSSSSLHSIRAAAFAWVFVAMLVVVATLGIVRLLFICKFASFDLFADNLGAVPLFLLNALRFDAQIGTYASLPLLVGAIVVCIAPAKTHAHVARFSRVYIAVAATIVGLVALADVHWYNNFSRHFDIVAFDFFDEEPSVLIKGIINEAPLVPIVIGLAVLYFSAWFAGGWGIRLASRLFSGSMSITRLTVGSLSLLTLMVVASRGSLGTFTLRPEDVYVSSSNLMNDCVPNGIFMLKKAWSERKDQFKMDDDEAILARAGFKTESEAAATWLSRPDTGHLTADSALVAYGDTKKEWADYDVVVIVSESWGRLLMDYDSIYNIDLLCSMRGHLKEDLLWRDFLSATNGTIDAVEALTTSSPYRRLFTSRYRDTNLPLSTATVFRSAGYQTEFVSGIEISWRNLSEVLPHQGFDRVIGKFELLEQMPDAELNHTWGVYDHSMLTFLLSELQKPRTDSAPRFFMALTSTNHTPFEFPKDYELPALDLPADPAAFAISDEAVIRDYLRGYQYTSRALGDFMTALKASPAASHTIVAITGDHNTRLVLPYPEGSDPKLKYSVPFYLYVPSAPDSWRRFTSSRVGSHSDVVPTLVNLTMTGVPYLNAGQNLLADSIPGGTCGVNTEHVLYSADADRDAINRRLEALDALKQIWFKRQFSKP